MIVWGGAGSAGGIVASTTMHRYVDPCFSAWGTQSSLFHSSGMDGHRDDSLGWEQFKCFSFGRRARYNPTSDTWTPLSTMGAPSPRMGPTAVWTGTEMIVWGGRVDQTTLGDGGRYNPVTNTWTAAVGDGRTGRTGRTYGCVDRDQDGHLWWKPRV